MKTINTYINEKLQLTSKYSCQPKNKIELLQIIIYRIKNDGNECDLNDIDVSKIKDMSCLFYSVNTTIFKDFNGNISMWNVSNVTNMSGMFYRCEKFNCDLSMWDVSNVEKMNSMFYMCKKFDCDLSKWDVLKVEDMGFMFAGCEEFCCDLSRWDMSNVDNMYGMFWRCKKFKQNLNSWDISKVEDMENAFKDCPTKPTWYDKDKWERNNI